MLRIESNRTRWPSNSRVGRVLAVLGLGVGGRGRRGRTRGVLAVLRLGVGGRGGGAVDVHGLQRVAPNNRNEGRHVRKNGGGNNEASSLRKIKATCPCPCVKIVKTRRGPLRHHEVKHEQINYAGVSYAHRVTQAVCSRRRTFYSNTFCSTKADPVDIGPTQNVTEEEQARGRPSGRGQGTYMMARSSGVSYLRALLTLTKQARHSGP